MLHKHQKCREIGAERGTSRENTDCSPQSRLGSQGFQQKGKEIGAERGTHRDKNADFSPQGQAEKGTGREKHRLEPTRTSRKGHRLGKYRLEPTGTGRQGRMQEKHRLEPTGAGLKGQACSINAET